MKRKAESAPICKYHRRAMKLVDAAIPFFYHSPSESLKRPEITRQIYRCPVERCPVVAAGPLIEAHGARECSLEMVNPW